MRLLLTILLILVPVTGMAATWHVEKDGTGDFSIIQDAVDAAADGDTILIGSGRYIDNLYTHEAVLIASRDNLTITGAGEGQTIIGPDLSWTVEDVFICGILCGQYYGSDVISISGLRFENMGIGIKSDHCTLVNISECEFYTNARSVGGYGGSMEVVNCMFEYTARDYNHIISHSQDSLRVQGCAFVLYDDFNWSQTHIHLEGTIQSIISGCEFIGGSGGITASSQSSVITSDCQFSGMRRRAFLSYWGTSQKITDCTISECNYAFLSYDGAGYWEVERVIVADVTTATLLYRNPVLGFMRDNIFDKGDQYVVERRPYDGLETHFDMTNNWWGTTEPDSIAAWIYDANDIEGTGQIIDFVPFKQQPVKTDQKSWGQMKNMFR